MFNSETEKINGLKEVWRKEISDYKKEITVVATSQLKEAKRNQSEQYSQALKNRNMEFQTRVNEQIEETRNDFSERVEAAVQERTATADAARQGEIEAEVKKRPTSSGGSCNGGSCSDF